MNYFVITLLSFAFLILGWLIGYIFFGIKGLKSAEPKYSDNKDKPRKKKFGTMNIILILIGVFLLIFTGYMIYLFREYGAIPDTLVTCVFASLAGECGIMGWIKTSKERKRERKWELEDRNDMEE